MLSNQVLPGAPWWCFQVVPDSSKSCSHAFLHTYLHTYLHTCKHTYMPTILIGYISYPGNPWYSLLTTPQLTCVRIRPRWEADTYFIKTIIARPGRFLRIRVKNLHKPTLVIDATDTFIFLSAFMEGIYLEIYLYILKHATELVV